MKGDRLDDYIARFKHLATEAGFPLDDPGTLEIFVSKFPIHLLTMILSRGDNVFSPDTATFTQWSTQARNEMKNSVRNTNILRNAWPSAWQVNSSYKSNQSLYRPAFGQQSHQSHHTSHRSRNDKMVPMDVDTIRKAVTAEQKAEYRKECHCFKCEKQGHMARECPNKPKKMSQYKPPFKQQCQGSYQQCSSYKQQQHRKFKPRTSFARIVEIDSDNEDKDPMSVNSNSGPNELSISDLAAHAVCFSNEQCEEWVQEMKKCRADFQ